MSETVSRTVPGLFMVPTTAISPSSTALRVMTPSMGARMVVLLSESVAESICARAWAMRAWPLAFAASWALTAVRRRWISASEMMCWR